MRSVADNLKSIRGRIERAALRVGRDPSDIKLVAVTKNVSVPQIEEAITAGVTDIGENRAQEALGKFRELGGRVTWHFVGHLQTNKVKYVVDFVELVHSVDSLRLAKEMERRARDGGKVQKILVEVNVSGERSKFGLPSGELMDFLEEITGFKHLAVEGLMTMAPLVDDPEMARPVFSSLRKLFEKVKEEGPPGVKMRYLSMGMTNDFEVAIEEGSNMVRIGTGIFGLER